jgi:hypothetical protein
MHVRVSRYSPGGLFTSQLTDRPQFKVLEHIEPPKFYLDPKISGRTVHALWADSPPFKKTVIWLQRLAGGASAIQENCPTRTTKGFGQNFS